MFVLFSSEDDAVRTETRGQVTRLVAGHLGEGLVELLADGLELLLLVAQLICGGKKKGEGA